MTTANARLDNSSRNDILVLNDKEINLIRLLRSVAFGQVTVFVKNGAPVRAENIKESVEL